MREQDAEKNPQQKTRLLGYLVCTNKQDQRDEPDQLNYD